MNEFKIGDKVFVKQIVPVHGTIDTNYVNNTLNRLGTIVEDMYYPTTGEYTIKIINFTNGNPYWIMQENDLHRCEECYSCEYKFRCITNND